MILYVNGDSNAAAAEAVNAHGFAEDDGKYWRLGRQPHPDNLAVSWGKKLADQLGAELYCDAESASSNDRIIRTTYNYINNGKRPDYIVIGWSTWEREEWFDGGRWWQVNAGGIGEDWPDAVKNRYKEWISTIDYRKKMRQSENNIYFFHLKLVDLKIPHLFFTCYETFHRPDLPDLAWGKDYIEPYNNEYTYYHWLTARGFKPVYPGSYHFGPDAHTAWAELLYQFMVQKSLTSSN